MRSPDGATRLALIGMPAGMDTRAPRPATLAVVVKACGGGEETLLIVRSEAVITVLAAMSWLATTILEPEVVPWIRGRLAMPAAVANASTASTAPMTM